MKYIVILFIGFLVNLSQAAVWVSKTYSTVKDHQESIDCSITECVNEETDPDFVDIVAKEEMKLPVNCMKGESVIVTFSYNANQTMDCEFVHEKSGTKVSRQISMNSSD